MSLIITKNFKRAKAQGAQDAQGDEVIAQKNGYKLVHNTLNDGYWFYTKSGAGWGITATNKVAAINEFNRLVGSAKDAAELNNDADLRAEDANFKVGDRVTVKTKWAGTRKGIVKEVINDPALKKAYVVEIEGAETAAYPAEIVSADACDAMDANFKVGDKVRVWQQPVYGKLGEVVEATYGGMEYTVNVEGKDYPRIDYRRIVKMSDAAGDAATFKVGDLVRMSEGGLTGKITKIEPNGHFRVSFLYNKANGFSQSFSANEIVMVKPAADSAEFQVGQRVRAKDPAYEYSDGKALGAGMFTVKEVNNNGDVKLDDYGDVWISPSALVEANDACGKGKDRCGRDGCGKDGNSEYELGMKVLKAVGKVEDEIVAGVRRAKQLVNNVPDEDVRRRLNRKLDDIAKIAESFDDTFI